MKKFYVLLLIFTITVISCSPDLGNFLITEKRKEGKNLIFGLASPGKDSIEIFKVDPKLYYNKKVGEDSVRVKADFWSSALYLPKKQK